LLLQILADQKRVIRRTWEIAVLCILYGVGTVYFFSAVQGSVWYTAHMVGGVFLMLYAICSLDGRHPLWAGIFVGFAFACRPPMLLAFPFFIYELLRSRADDSSTGFFRWMFEAMRDTGLRRILGKLCLFGLPLVVIIGGLMVMNWARFDDPFEFGHNLLQVRWRGRIEHWGLFNYHYLARNLTVSFALLPWLSADEPYIGISRHGLALWFTTPVLFWVLWPKTANKFYAFLVITTAAIAIPELLYQNTGWIQFGYRFALDFIIFMILMIAAGGRKLGRLFFVLLIFSIGVNLFGAMTFDRGWKYYPGQSTATYFEPD
jgi:hypothetical protein